MKAYALTHTDSQSRLGILWITSIVMEATSAPLTDNERRPRGKKQSLFMEDFSQTDLYNEIHSFQAELLCLSRINVLDNEGVSVTTHTNDCIQSEGTLSEDFFVACHCGPLLTSFPVQVS